MTSVPAGLISAREHNGDPLITAVNGEVFRMMTRDFKFAAIQIGAKTGEALPGAGAITLEGSNDGLNWVATPYVTVAGVVTATGILSVTAATIVFVATPFIFVRGRVSTLITGAPASPYIVILNEDDDTLANIFVGQATMPVSGTVTATVSGASLSAGGTTGGFATNRLVSCAATVNNTNVKGSGGRVYEIEAFNTSAAVKFLKLYNKATAPVAGTDTPIVTLALAVGANHFSWADIGILFSTGIGFALTGAVADADTTALAAGDIVALDIFYN